MSHPVDACARIEQRRFASEHCGDA
jgi:hypothetical protein